MKTSVQSTDDYDEEDLYKLGCKGICKPDDRKQIKELSRF